MATLSTLHDAGQVHKLDPALGPGEQEFRLIYALPPLRDWLQNVLPNLESDWRVEQSPLEQLDALIEIFCSGDTLTYGWQFKPLTHIREGVWQLKTADIRIFGWFCVRDCFIGSSADLKSRIKELGLYHGYKTETVLRRNALQLDEPKFIPGDNPHAVVSAFDYP